MCFFVIYLLKIITSIITSAYCHFLCLLFYNTFYRLSIYFTRQISTITILYQFLDNPLQNDIAKHTLSVFPFDTANAHPKWQ